MAAKAMLPMRDAFRTTSWCADWRGTVRRCGVHRRNREGRALPGTALWKSVCRRWSGLL